MEKIDVKIVLNVDKDKRKHHMTYEPLPDYSKEFVFFFCSCFISVKKSNLFKQKYTYVVNSDI